MKDLMTAYEEARFGKSAAGTLSRIADYFAMSKLTPENRELRDTIESSIRDEKRLREQAKGEITTAKKRLKGPADQSAYGWIVDLMRSAVPGLAPTAAPKDDGIEKKSVDVELDEGPSTVGTLAHLLAGGTGAGIGAGVQSGYFGGQRAAQLLSQALPSDAVKKIVGASGTTGAGKKVLQQALEQLDPTEIAMLTQKPSTSILRRLSDAIYGARGGDPAMAAEKNLVSKIIGAAKGMKKGRPAASTLSDIAMRTPAFISRAFRDWRSKVPAGGWRLGAGVGAAAATLPFILYNLLRARRVRAQGGPATGAAATRAAQLLAQANKLQSERQGLLPKLSQ